MRQRVIIYVNGILTFPGESGNWNGRAVTWTHLHDDARAEKVEYFCGPIDRAFGQKERAQKLALTIQYYKGWNITLVGHSNGTDVILKALDLLRWPRIEAVHLVSGACEADFDKNGLNDALEGNCIGKVCVYVGGKDRALALAHSWAGRILGYGVLGLRGPLSILPAIKDRVGVLTWPDYGHSDCWADANFTQTMEHFV